MHSCRTWRLNTPRCVDSSTESLELHPPSRALRSQREAERVCTRGAIRAPGTIHAYQAVSEEINRSLGLVTPPVRVFDPVQSNLQTVQPLARGLREWHLSFQAGSGYSTVVAARTHGDRRKACASTAATPITGPASKDGWQCVELSQLPDQCLTAPALDYR
jgi:hypothetical protein